jgi:ankyrin repeat protein
MNNLDDKIQDAICNNDIRYIKYFIETYGVDYRFLDDDNDSLISFAISDGGSNSYKTILDFNPDLNYVNDLGETIFHSVVYSNIVSRLYEIINKGINVSELNNYSNDGVTPLLLSISIQKFEIALELVKLGADVNIPDEIGVSPLHCACMFDNLEIVRELIEHGSDLNQKTEKGNLPLALAVNNGNSEIIKYIYDKQFGIK